MSLCVYRIRLEREAEDFLDLPGEAGFEDFLERPGEDGAEERGGGVMEERLRAVGVRDLLILKEGTRHHIRCLKLGIQSKGNLLAL